MGFIVRYIIGIDLGTTNTCVAYADMENSRQSIQNFRIPQLKSLSAIEDLPTLSSCCCLTSPGEWPSGALDLPWSKNPEVFVGFFAKDYGSRIPTKLVCSAKSWLCHSGANRREKILPFEASDTLQRISPIEASALYLRHVREAWNHLMAKGDVENEFDQQAVILTVPASFDEVARSLTVEAAKMAGYTHVTLLEEPQAAFYSWIAQHEHHWAKKLYPGSRILVCDIGGGTTDFSLIEVCETEGKLGFQRQSVGDHLLLGGDNMDAALAHFIEAKLKEELQLEFTHFQWLQILHQARKAKEALLSENAPLKYSVAIQGAGSQIVQNTLTLELKKNEVEELLLKGFWGITSWDEAKIVRKGSGIRSLGLPYEEEPSITKHLAHFLEGSARAGRGEVLKPDFILFNGGAVKPLFFQQAILESLKTWFPEKNPKILESYHLDLAVARGAVYYGKARQGHGIRIGGGVPRAYYFAVETQEQKDSLIKQAITLVPRGAEEGSIFELKHSFWSRPNTPIAFRMYSSNIRLDDKVGDLISIDPKEMQLHPPIHTLLRFGKGSLQETAKEMIPVHLVAALTPLGTLEVGLKSQISDHRWSLEFQLRKESGQENSLSVLDKRRQDETFDLEYLLNAQKVIKKFYQGDVDFKSSQIMEHLEKTLDQNRQDWSLNTLRELWTELNKQAPQRKTSLEKEARWWNLAGFLLRPGYGFPLDDFRLKELWKIILADSKSNRSPDCLLQSWICYRRVAGGLNKGQQMQLSNDLLTSIYSKKSGKIEIKNKNELYLYHEKIRSLAAMEFLDMSIKEKLGCALLARIESRCYSSADLWALGRIGARHLVYGSLAHVIPREVCSRWVKALLEKTDVPPEALSFLIGQLARKTKLRELNLPDELLQQSLRRFESTGYLERLKTLLFEDGDLTKEEQGHIFGDNLPLGLSLSQA